jgi:hypothetical protein
MEDTQIIEQVNMDDDVDISDEDEDEIILPWGSR